MKLINNFIYPIKEYPHLSTPAPHAFPIDTIHVLLNVHQHVSINKCKLNKNPEPQIRICDYLQIFVCLFLWF